MNKLEPRCDISVLAWSYSVSLGYFASFSKMDACLGEILLKSQDLQIFCLQSFAPPILPFPESILGIKQLHCPDGGRAHRVSSLHPLISFLQEPQMGVLLLSLMKQKIEAFSWKSSSKKNVLVK